MKNKETNEEFGFTRKNQLFVYNFNFFNKKLHYLCKLVLHQGSMRSRMLVQN